MSNQGPKVEILVATFNGEKYIKELLESLLWQTYKNIKITIHDDGSKDKTLGILMEYNQKYPDIINLINDNIVTGSALRNFELLLAKSSEDYVIFADQDDVWLLNKVEITLSKMLELEKKCGKNIPLLVYTNTKVVDEKINVLSEDFWDYICVNGSIKSFAELYKLQ
ncbi:MAG: glycosyltransferase [Brevinematia bacterium]